MNHLSSEPGKRRRKAFTSAAFFTLAAILWIVFQLPWITQWGSTASERTTPMTGDEIVSSLPRGEDRLFTPYHAAVYTRSVTVDAAPERIWPWLIQMGQDKGGFYTYDWAERLFLDPMHNAMQIQKRWQNLQAGDEVHPFPTGTPWIASIVEPNRVLVLQLEDGSWSWATELKPVTDGQTRVVTRFKSAPRTVSGKVASNVFLGPADLIVFPRVLYGLKQRAEGTLPGMPGTFVGSPFPTARLPVHWGAALAWIVGTAAVVLLAGNRLGIGRIGEPRPHSGMTLFGAFVAGSGYMLLSDTPPGQILANRWGVGLVLALVMGPALARWVGPDEQIEASLLRSTGRAVMAVCEAGVLVVLPVVAVWHAATALGWTGSVIPSVLTGLVGVVAAGAIGWVAATASGPHPGRTGLTWILLAAGFALSGSALVPLVGGAMAELVAGRVTAPYGSQRNGVRRQGQSTWRKESYGRPRSHYDHTAGR